MAFWNRKNRRKNKEAAEPTAVSAFAESAAPEREVPVTVTAPVIFEGMTEAGVEPLLDYVAALQSHCNTEMAEKETERLQPYFGALNVYLTQALERTELEEGEAKKLKGLSAPRELSALFNAMAAHTRNTLLSDVVILPDNIGKGPAGHLFKDTAYNPTFKYGEHSFSFGFMQIFEGGNKKEARSSTTIPTFTLDTQRMQEIAPHRSEELLQLFQKVVTIMNHDMLHHYHSPWINSIIAHKFINGGGYDRKGDIYQWAWRTRVEEWSQVSHGKIFMAPGNEALIKDVGTKLGLYFDELERIGKALPKEKAHEVIDYFGTVMAQTLSRTFPLNHPLLAQCLDRMQKADPFTESELLEKAMEQYGRMIRISSLTSCTLDNFRRRADRDTVRIIKGYRQEGCDIFPDDDKAMNYQKMKLLQLIKLEAEDMRSHVPTPIDDRVTELRANSDRRFLELVGAVAKVSGYSPV